MAGEGKHLYIEIENEVILYYFILIENEVIYHPFYFPIEWTNISIKHQWLLAS